MYSFTKFSDESYKNANYKKVRLINKNFSCCACPQITDFPWNWRTKFPDFETQV
jgi:hypothetical protein